jgi:hypothetical protein
LALPKTNTFDLNYLNFVKLNSFTKSHFSIFSKIFIDFLNNDNLLLEEASDESKNYNIYLKKNKIFFLKIIKTIIKTIL